MARRIPCPFCEGKVLPKKNMRTMATVTGWLERNVGLKIPLGLLDFFLQFAPVSKTQLRKEASSCEACEGRRTIEDPSDDSDRIAQSLARAREKADRLAFLESELAPACGNRYTIIQGSELLEVGLGFNDAPSYRVDEQMGVRAGGILDPAQVNPEKGGPQIPQGKRCNHVQGINSLASPGGHYFVKCANKFQVLAGAQGIELTTGGPLTINAGITKITGPELSIGTQTGRLSLEGEVMNLNAKSIEAAPTDGHFYVKGTISNTGNLLCAGHSHLESASVVKMETTGRNEPSKSASPSDLYSGPAFWGGMGIEGLIATIKDQIGHVQSRLTNPVELVQVLSFRIGFEQFDKSWNLGYNMRPWELLPTGVILPGTCFTLGIGNLGYPVVSVNPTFVPVFNFPHTHALPGMSHNHETRIPDIDCTADTAAQLRMKQGGTASSAPLFKKTGSARQVFDQVFAGLSSAWAVAWKGIQGVTPYLK